MIHYMSILNVRVNMSATKSNFTKSETLGSSRVIRWGAVLSHATSCRYAVNEPYHSWHQGCA